MRRPQVIENDAKQIATIGDLASVFEGIASLRIARVKDKVVSAKVFFGELWQIYTQLRVDPTQRLTTPLAARIAKDVFLVITSEGGLSGDIDNKIVSRVQQDYRADKNEVIVLGSHGATLLSQAGIPVARGYHLPDTDVAPDVRPIIEDMAEYQNAAVYYQTYVSLGVQQVARIDLISAVKALGEDAETEGLISEHGYIFEPSTLEIVEYMESVMLGITLGQAILESRLAQFASRYNAMSVAGQRSKELAHNFTLEYRQAKRSQSDERLKEVMISLKGL